MKRTKRNSAKRVSALLRPKDSSEFASNVASLQNDGYMAMPMRQIFGEGVAQTPGWEDVLNCQLGEANKEREKHGPGMFASSGNEYACDTCGTPGLGWMEWGNANRLPNIVSLLTGLLPYTAVSAKYNTDTASGLGPKPLYRYTLTSNGTAKAVEIDYESAGPMLEAEIAATRKALADHFAKCRENGIDLNARAVTVPEGEDNSVLGDIPSTADEDEIRVNQEIRDALKERVKKAVEAYEVWSRTNKEVKEFMERNNLDAITLKMYQDMVYFGICFPDIELSLDPNVSDADWKPRATGISHHSALTCRMERMDEFGRINYVYISNRWLDTPYVTDKAKLEDDIEALPTINPEHPITDINAKLRKIRLNGNKKSYTYRPTHFIFPSSYPTPGRPYYPQPASHSIFGGDIYSYASTMISDRAARKRNSNIFGRIVYVHTDYLKQLYLQSNATTPDAQEKLRDTMWNQINVFLQNPENAGQSLLSFSFTGSDGKEHDAYRIVEVPYNSKNQAAANEKELSEISSIIFFAFEIHPDLIGARPGEVSSSGGTDKRELTLLKQLRMAPTQNIVLKPLEVISRLNEWDEHLQWRQKQMVLTTLDRNKNGMEEQSY